MDFNSDMAGYANHSRLFDAMVAHAWHMADELDLGEHVVVMAHAVLEIYLLGMQHGEGASFLARNPLSSYEGNPCQSREVAEFIAGPCKRMDHFSLMMIQSELAVPLLSGEEDLRAELAAWEARWLALQIPLGEQIEVCTAHSKRL